MNDIQTIEPKETNGTVEISFLGKGYLRGTVENNKIVFEPNKNYRIEQVGDDVFITRIKPRKSAK